MCPVSQSSDPSSHEEPRSGSSTSHSASRRRRYGVHLSKTNGFTPSAAHALGKNPVNVFRDGRLRNSNGCYVSKADVIQDMTTIGRYPSSASRMRLYCITTNEMPSETLYEINALNIEGVLGQVKIGMRLTGMYDTYGRLNLDIPHRMEVSGGCVLGVAVSLVEANIKMGRFSVKAKLTTLDAQILSHGIVNNKGVSASLGGYAALLKGNAVCEYETSHIKLTVGGSGYIGAIGAGASANIGKSTTGLYRIQFSVGSAIGIGGKCYLHAELGEKPSKALDNLLSKLPNGQKLFLAIQPDQLSAESLHQFSSEQVLKLHKQTINYAEDSINTRDFNQGSVSADQVGLIFGNEDYILHRGRTANVFLLYHRGLSYQARPIFLTSSISNLDQELVFRAMPSGFSFERFLSSHDDQMMSLSKVRLGSYKQLIGGMGGAPLDQSTSGIGLYDQPHMQRYQDSGKVVLDNLDKNYRPRTVIEAIKEVEWDFFSWLKVIPAGEVKIDNSHSVEIGITLTIIDGVLTISPYAKVGVAAVIALSRLALNRHKEQRAKKAQDAYNKGIKPINEGLDRINAKVGKLEGVHNSMLIALFERQGVTYEMLGSQARQLQAELVQDIEAHKSQLIEFRRDRPHSAYKNWDDTVNDVLRPAMVADDQLRDGIKNLEFDVSLDQFEKAYKHISSQLSSDDYYQQSVRILRYVYQKILRDDFDANCVTGVRLILNNAFTHDQVQGEFESVFMIAMNAVTSQENINPEDWQSVIENSMRYYQYREILSDVECDAMSMIGKLTLRFFSDDCLTDEYYQFYQRVMQQDERNSLWPTILAIHHQSMEDWEGVISVVHPWLEVQEDDSLRTALSNAYYKVNKFDEALQSIMKKPEDDWSDFDRKCYLLSKQHCATQENGYAEEVYSTAMNYMAMSNEFDPDYVRIAMHVLEVAADADTIKSRWSALHSLLNDYDMSQQASPKKIMTPSELDELNLLKAYVRIGLSEYDEANQLLSSLSKGSNTKNSDEISFLRSKISYIQEEFDAALKHLNLLSDEELRMPSVIKYRTQLYINNKESEKAWESLKALPDDHAELPDILELKKWICFDRGYDHIDEAFDYHDKLPESLEMLQEAAMLALRHDRGLKAQAYINKIKKLTQPLEHDNPNHQVLRNLDAGFQYWRGFFCFELAQLLAPVIYQACHLDHRVGIMFDTLLETGSQSTFHLFLSKLNPQLEKHFSSQHMNRDGMDYTQTISLSTFYAKQMFYLLQADLAEPYEKSYLSYMIDSDSFKALQQYQSWAGRAGYIADVVQFSLGLQSLRYPVHDPALVTSERMMKLISIQNVLYAGLGLLSKGFDVYDQWHLEKTGMYNTNEAFNFAKSFSKSVVDNPILNMYMFSLRASYFMFRFPGSVEITTKILQDLGQFTVVEYAIKPVIVVAEAGAGYFLTNAMIAVLKRGVENKFSSAASKVTSFMTKHAFKFKAGFWVLVAASIARDTAISWRKISIDKVHQNVMMLMNDAEYVFALSEIKKTSMPNLPPDREWLDWVWDLGADTMPEHVTHKILSLNILYTLRKLKCFIEPSTDFKAYKNILKDRHCFNKRKPKSMRDLDFLSFHSRFNDVEKSISMLIRYIDEGYLDSSARNSEHGDSVNTIKDMGILLLRDMVVDKYSHVACEQSDICEHSFFAVINRLDQHHDAVQIGCGKADLYARLGDLEIASQHLSYVSSQFKNNEMWPHGCHDASIRLDHWWNRVSTLFGDLLLRAIRSILQSFSHRYGEEDGWHRRLVLWSHAISVVRESFVTRQLSQTMPQERFFQMLPWVCMRLSSIFLDFNLVYFKQAYLIIPFKLARVLMNGVSTWFLYVQLMDEIELNHTDPALLQAVILVTQIQSILSDVLSLIAHNKTPPDSKAMLRLRLWLESYMYMLNGSYVMTLTGNFLTARQFLVIDYPDHQSLFRISSKLSWIKNINCATRSLITLFAGFFVRQYWSLHHAMGFDTTSTTQSELFLVDFLSNALKFLIPLFQSVTNFFLNDSVQSGLFYGLVLIFGIKFINNLVCSYTESSQRYVLITDYDEIKNSIESQQFNKAYKIIVNCERKYNAQDSYDMGLLRFKAMTLLYKDEPDPVTAYDAILKYITEKSSHLGSETRCFDELSYKLLVQAAIQLTVKSVGHVSVLRKKLNDAGQYCDQFLLEHPHHRDMHGCRIKLILKKCQHSVLLSVDAMGLMIDQLKESYAVLDENDQIVVDPILDGLVYKKMPGDGHCLYHAVGSQVGIGYRSLRRRIANYLSDHPDLFEEIIGSGDERNIYIQQLRETNKYGGHVELEVLRRLTGRTIVIIRPEGRATLLDQGLEQRNNPIFLYFNDCEGSLAHFDAFTVKQGSCGADILTRIRRELLMGECVTFSPGLDCSALKEQAVLCIAELEKVVHAQQRPSVNRHGLFKLVNDQPIGGCSDTVDAVLDC